VLTLTIGILEQTNVRCALPWHLSNAPAACLTARLGSTLEFSARSDKSPECVGMMGLTVCCTIDLLSRFFRPINALNFCFYLIANATFAFTDGSLSLLTHGPSELNEK